MPWHPPSQGSRLDVSGFRRRDPVAKKRLCDRNPNPWRMSIITAFQNYHSRLAFLDSGNVVGEPGNAFGQACNTLPQIRIAIAGGVGTRNWTVKYRKVPATAGKKPGLRRVCAPADLVCITSSFVNKLASSPHSVNSENVILFAGVTGGRHG